VHTRKHVFSDLQPYICTYSDCQLHEYFFDSLNDWFHHESRTHRVEWFCNTDSHPSFVDKKDFLDHIHAVHAEPLDETQLLSLHQGFQRPSDAYAGTCTLCGQYANRLKSHLARHLEQLALFAIPQTDYMAPIEEDDTSSNAARQDMGALSSIASTRAVSNPWRHESGSEVSADSLGHINNRSRSKAPADDQYSNQYEEPESVSRDDIREEVDTSWDLITPKFKDARIGLQGDQEAETPKRQLQPMFPDAAIYEKPMDARPTDPPARLFDEPQEVVSIAMPLAPRDAHAIPPFSDPMSRQPGKAEIDTSNVSKPPPSFRERAGRITSNLFSPFRSQKKDQNRAQSGRPELDAFPEMPGDTSQYLNRRRSLYQVPPSVQETLQDLSSNLASRSSSVPAEIIGPNDPNYPPSTFSGYSDGPAYEPSLAPSDVRTGWDTSVSPTQPLDVYPDSNPTEGTSRKGKRTWRQRLSKAIGIRDRSPPEPAINQLPYYPTVSDLGNRSGLSPPPSYPPSMSDLGNTPSLARQYNPTIPYGGSTSSLFTDVAEGPTDEVSVHESPEREVDESDAARQMGAVPRDMVLCNVCAMQWYLDEQGLNCPACGSTFTEIKTLAANAEVD
jgi:hypothetical protein